MIVLLEIMLLFVVLNKVVLGVTLTDPNIWIAEASRAEHRKSVFCYSIIIS